MDIPVPLLSTTVWSGAVLVIVITGVVVGFTTDAEIPVPDITPTEVTVPLPTGIVQVLFNERSCVRPFIVIVLVLGTGVYPRAVYMSPAATGAADVTSPFAFTANFKNVFDPYTLLFTVKRVSVTGLPVTPDPVTSPPKKRISEGRAMFVGIMLVTSPFEFTVTTGTCTVDPYVPGLGLTELRVKTAEPGPVAVPSPVKADI